MHTYNFSNQTFKYIYLFDPMREIQSHSHSFISSHELVTHTAHSQQIFHQNLKLMTTSLVSELKEMRYVCHRTWKEHTHEKHTTTHSLIMVFPLPTWENKRGKKDDDRIIRIRNTKESLRNFTYPSTKWSYHRSHSPTSLCRGKARNPIGCSTLVIGFPSLAERDVEIVQQTGLFLSLTRLHLRLRTAVKQSIRSGITYKRLVSPNTPFLEGGSWGCPKLRALSPWQPDSGLRRVNLENLISVRYSIGTAK